VILKAGIKTTCERLAYFSRKIGKKRLSIDETSLSNGELYTILTTKPLKVKGSIVAMIAGTKAESVIAVINKFRLKTKSGYRDLRYGSKHGINCQKNVSPNEAARA
jgi:hypothetical protein